MYEIFGEFDSYEEINLCAAGLKSEGDIQNLLVLANENGISEEIAKRYINGDMQELTDPYEAMCAKLELELKESKINVAPAQAIVDYLMIIACEKQSLALGIRKKGKSLEKCCEEIGEEAKKLVKEQKGLQTVNMPDLTVFKMAELYYTRGL